MAINSVFFIFFVRLKFPKATKKSSATTVACPPASSQSSSPSNKDRQKRPCSEPSPLTSSAGKNRCRKSTFFSFSLGPHIQLQPETRPNDWLQPHHLLWSHHLLQSYQPPQGLLLLPVATRTPSKPPTTPPALPDLDQVPSTSFWMGRPFSSPPTCNVQVTARSIYCVLYKLAAGKWARNCSLKVEIQEE